MLFFGVRGIFSDLYKFEKRIMGIPDEHSTPTEE